MLRLKSALLLCLLYFYLISASEIEEKHRMDTNSVEFVVEIISIVLLVLLSGVVAGLALGLMSLDTTNLSILMIAGTPKEKKYASRIIPIRKNGHILLTTLLLTNTVINETLPILFDGIFSEGFVSIIASTVLLVLFAEIIPQSVFSKHGLAIGAFFAVPVRILIGIWFIIGWPISKFLDWLIGAHTGFIYTVPQFNALVQLHDQSKYAEGTLKPETVHLVQNVFSMQNKELQDILTPTADMLMLTYDTVLNRAKIQDYLDEGHVFLFVSHNTELSDDDNESNQPKIGVLNLKTLLKLDDDSLEKTVGSMASRPSLAMLSTATAVEAMNQFARSNNKEQVILVYHSDSATERQASIKGSIVLPSTRSASLAEHSRNLSCMMKTIIGRTCYYCHPESSESRCDPDETLSSPLISFQSVIDSELLGIVTFKDVLEELLSFNHAFKEKDNYNIEPLRKVMSA